MKYLAVILSLAVLCNGASVLNLRNRSSILEGIRELVQSFSEEAGSHSTQIHTAHQNVLAYASQLNGDISDGLDRTVNHSLQVLNSLESLEGDLGLDVNKECPLESSKEHIKRLKSVWSHNHFQCTEQNYLNATRLMVLAREEVQRVDDQGQKYINDAVHCQDDLLCLNELYKTVKASLPKLRQDAVKIAVLATNEFMEINGRILVCDSENVRQLAVSAQAIINSVTECVRKPRQEVGSTLAPPVNPLA